MNLEQTLGRRVLVTMKTLSADRHSLPKWTLYREINFRVI